MVTFLEYKPNWAVSLGGTGVSVMHFYAASDYQGVADRVRTFFNALVTLLPNEVTMSFPPEVTEHQVAGGALVSVHTVTPPATVVGSFSGNYSLGVGCRLDLRTILIVGGRRLKGRIFLVPLNNTNNDGSVVGTTNTTLQTAGDTLRTTSATAGTNWAVWSRKYSALSDVVSVEGNFRPAWLQTRKR